MGMPAGTTPRVLCPASCGDCEPENNFDVDSQSSSIYNSFGLRPNGTCTENQDELFRAWPVMDVEARNSAEGPCSLFNEDDLSTMCFRDFHDFDSKSNGFFFNICQINGFCLNFGLNLLFWAVPLRIFHVKWNCESLLY